MRHVKVAQLRADRLFNPVLIGYCCGDLATFAKLAFFDGYSYNWWNWLLALPANLLISSIWPLYWAFFRPVFVG